ncbi:MAG: class B sortase, partial [Ruminococcus sp.]|nr:class B sortase [Ruminococcus sp.]
NDKLNEILNSVDSKLKPENKSFRWEDEINSVLEKRSDNNDIEEILKSISTESKKTEPVIKKIPKKIISHANDPEELVEQITVGKKVTELSQQKKNIPEESDKIHEDKKSNTLVYNTLVRKIPEKEVIPVMAENNVKKIPRLENNIRREPVAPADNAKKIPVKKPVKKQPEKKPPETKRKKSFMEKFLDLFPQKEDSVLEKIRKVVFLCSIVAIVVCGYMVGDYYIDLGKSKNLHEEIASIYEPYHPPVPAQNVSTIYEPDYEREYSFLDGARKLLDMNPDVVGYITIPDTLVANPVMQYTDNEKYLDQNINGDTSRAGEIFLDYRNNFDKVVDNKLSVENSDNLVIYGHNMGNDTMFGCLKYYQRNSGYYNQHPVIYLNSNYECYTYKIFAYFILDAMDESETAYDCWNKFDFDDEQDFYNFVNEAKKRTLTLNDVDVQYGDKILTLSTCNTILGDRGRLIVMGRLLRDGEDTLEGTQQSVQNTNIKWPSIYYQQKPNERYNPDAEFIPYG